MIIKFYPFDIKSFIIFFNKNFKSSVLITFFTTAFFFSLSLFVPNKKQIKIIFNPVQDYEIDIKILPPDFYNQNLLFPPISSHVFDMFKENANKKNFVFFLYELKNKNILKKDELKIDFLVRDIGKDKEHVFQSSNISFEKLENIINQFYESELKKISKSKIESLSFNYENSTLRFLLTTYLKKCSEMKNEVAGIGLSQNIDCDSYNFLYTKHKHALNVLESYKKDKNLMLFNSQKIIDSMYKERKNLQSISVALSIFGFVFGLVLSIFYSLYSKKDFKKKIISNKL